MVASVRSRRDFAELSRAGRTSRSGPLAVRHVAGHAVGRDEGEARIAYAIGRPVGNAVTRNRLRRRLRELCRAMERDGLLAPGLYLVSARPGAALLDGRALRSHLRAAMPAMRQAAT